MDVNSQATRTAIKTTVAVLRGWLEKLIFWRISKEEKKAIEERTFLIVIVDQLLGLAEQYRSLGTEYTEEDECMKHRVKLRDALRALVKRTRLTAKANWLAGAAREHEGILKTAHEKLNDAEQRTDLMWENLREYIDANNEPEGRSAEVEHRGHFRRIANHLNIVAEELLKLHREAKSAIRTDR